MKKLVLSAVFLACTAIAFSQKPEISNGIKLKTSPTIKVIKAYLYYDDLSPVPDSNTAKLNENLNLLIKLQPGAWVVKNKFVKLGASEKITTNTGALVSEEKDLFANLKEINPEDARFINLKASMESMTGPVEYLLVSFRVWDKQGTAQITGSFKMRLKGED